MSWLSSAAHKVSQQARKINKIPVIGKGLTPINPFSTPKERLNGLLSQGNNAVAVRTGNYQQAFLNTISADSNATGAVRAATSPSGGNLVTGNGSGPTISTNTSSAPPVLMIGIAILLGAFVYILNGRK